MSNGIVMGTAYGLIFVSGILLAIGDELSSKKTAKLYSKILYMLIGAIWLGCYLLFVYDGFQTTSDSKLKIWLTGLVVIVPLALIVAFISYVYRSWRDYFITKKTS